MNAADATAHQPAERPPRLRRAQARGARLVGEIGPGASLYDVLSFVGRARWRGELVVESAGVRRSLFFDEGHVVAASSNADAEHIGEVLVAAGLLGRDQLVACLEKQEEGTLRFGEAAVALGFLTSELLFAEMSRVIEAVFAGAVAVTSGTFFFTSDFDEARLPFRRKLRVDALLVHAARAVTDASALPEGVRAPEAVPVRTSTGAPVADPLGVYAKIDGKATLQEIRRSTGRDELEVARALLELVEAGHVSIAPARLPLARVVQIYNEAIALLVGEIDDAAARDAVGAALAKFASEPHYVHVFGGAGPAADGTFDADAIAARVAGDGSPGALPEDVAALLYDYASYALFLARPHLARRDGEDDAAADVAARVAALLEDIAPPGDPTMAPPSSSKPRDLTRTTKSRRAEMFLFPGIDPARTVRMAPVSDERLRAARASTQKLEAVRPSMSPRARPAFRVPESPASSRPPRPSRRARDAKRSRAPTYLAVGGLAVAAGIAIATARLAPWDASSAGAEIVVVCDPSCGSLWVDGKKVEAVRGVVATSAGAHEVVGAAPGAPPALAKVVVADGESRAVVLKLDGAKR